MVENLSVDTTNRYAYSIGIVSFLPESGQAIVCYTLVCFIHLGWALIVLSQFLVSDQQIPQSFQWKLSIHTSVPIYQNTKQLNNSTKQTKYSSCGVISSENANCCKPFEHVSAGVAYKTFWTEIQQIVFYSCYKIAFNIWSNKNIDILSEKHQTEAIASFSYFMTKSSKYLHVKQMDMFYTKSQPMLINLKNSWRGRKSLS